MSSRLRKYLKENNSDQISLWDRLRQPHNPLTENLPERPEIKKMNFSQDIIEAVVIDAKYEGYLTKQQRMVAGLQSLENKKIPADLNYNSISHLRTEAKEKLSAFGPGTLGQASRISGITPADITVIQIHLKKTQSLKQLNK
jgi:tRNA uridine 5-carboxymethylaminomethyl modification enzyme